MTHPANDKNSHRIDRRTDEPWIIGMFAVCGLVASAFVLLMASNPDGGRLIAEAAQAEFPIIQTSSPPADVALPATGPTTRLAAGH
jgi:hypothetical protein